MRGVEPGRRGLKDHEVSQIINAVREAVAGMRPENGSLRGVIACAVLGKLRGLGLLMDEPGRPTQGH